jgi:RNA polymerase sigma-70 factor (ECF subfamily)
MPIALRAMEVETNAPMREGPVCDGPVCDGRIREFLETGERRRPQLLRMARRLTNSNEDAEDIVQEALMKAFKALAKFRGESQMSSWLGAIVQNTAHEHLRSRRNRVFVSIEYLNRQDNEVVEIDLPDPGKNPEEKWQSREMEIILREEVGKLGVVCRRAIEMCVLDEHPQLPAARSLNLSVATMKSRVFRGKRLLGRALSRRLGARHGGLAMAAEHRVSCEM